MSEKGRFFARLHPLDSLTSELRLMLDHLFLERRAPAVWQPVCDLYQTADAVIVTVELPGLTREDVEITVAVNLLTIAGRRPATSLPAHSIVHQHERRFGPFKRSLVMPSPVDAERTSARMADGLLTITLPHRKPRQITVSTESKTSETQPEESQVDSQGPNNQQPAAEGGVSPGEARDT